MEIKVLFLSQQRLLRESVQRVFKDVPGIKFVPPASTVVEAIAGIEQSNPDVVLIDLNPSLFGLRVVKALRDACPSCRMMALSSYDDPVAQTQLAIAGVHGFLTKDIGVDKLAAAIRAITAGETVFTRPFATAHTGPRVNRGLTARESEVFELIAQGFANKQVAAELGISIKTVEKHRQRLMQKLDSHETARLSWHAFCLGVAGNAYR
jgi:DNA-binding NarL/FixJ family response regulator